MNNTNPRLSPRDQLCDQIGDDDLLFMDGYDDCIIGVADRFGMETVVAYDKDKIIKRLIKDGMSLEEAEEFFFIQSNRRISWQ